MKQSNDKPNTYDERIRNRVIDGVDLTPDGIEAMVWDVEEWRSVWIPIVNWAIPEADFSKSHCSCGANLCLHRKTVWHFLEPLLMGAGPMPSASTFWMEAEIPTEFGPGAQYFRERLQLLHERSRRRAWTELAYRAYEENAIKKRD